MTDFLLCAILVVLAFKDRISETRRNAFRNEVISYVIATPILFLLLQFLKALMQGYLD